MAYKYLSDEIILGFDRYKYNSIDNSPISKYITHPFWNWVVEFYPRWIAPNVLTLVGFLMVVAQFILLTAIDPDFKASSYTASNYPPIPNWVWLFCAVALFLAHTLDGTDGKQARRTGSSGPLGELFDHGLDSWATLFMPMNLFSIFGCLDYSVSTTRLFYIIIAVQVTFIISHWEKYLTGILFLPWGYDISQIGMTAIYLVTWFGTYEMWKAYITDDILAGSVFEVGMHVGAICFSCPMAFWNVFQSYRNKTGYMRSFYESVRPLIPVVVLYSAYLIWIFNSPTDIINREARLIYVSSGTIFSNIACRLMVSGMSNTRCDAFNRLLWPLIIIVTAVLTLDLGVIEIYLLWVYTAVVLFAHIHYGCCVVYQLADHFDILIFRIKVVAKSNGSGNIKSPQRRSPRKKSNRTDNGL